MIENPSLSAALQSQWQAVIRMRERMDQLVISTFAFETSASPVFCNILYNLPFRLAIHVLKQALLQLSEVEQWIGSKRSLGDLMDGARTSLAWIDWPGLRECVERGNELIQHGKLFGDQQCLQAIADIEAQLLAWELITTPEPSDLR